MIRLGIACLTLCVALGAVATATDAVAQTPPTPAKPTAPEKQLPPSPVAPGTPTTPEKPQNPIGAPEKQGAPVTPNQGKADEVMLTGCLRATTEPTGYELAVKPATGVGSTGASQPAAAVYRLISVPPTLDLSKHLGHTVTVTGTGKSMANPSTPPPSTADAARAASPLQLHVTAIKHVSESCK